MDASKLPNVRKNKKICIPTHRDVVLSHKDSMIWVNWLHPCKFQSSHESSHQQSILYLEISFLSNLDLKNMNLIVEFSLNWYSTSSLLFALEWVKLVIFMHLWLLNRNCKYEMLAFIWLVRLGLSEDELGLKGSDLSPLEATMGWVGPPQCWVGLSRGKGKKLAKAGLRLAWFSKRQA